MTCLARPDGRLHAAASLDLSRRKAYTSTSSFKEPSMSHLDAPDTATLPAVPPCRNCGGKGRVLRVEISGVSPDVQYWRCDACGLVWATRNGEELRAIAAKRDSETIHRAPANLRRSNDDDLKARMDTAAARTRVLLKCSRAIRATVRSESGTIFTPRCVRCDHSGRTHYSALSSAQHYICAHCGGRWSVEPATA